MSEQSTIFRETQQRIASWLHNCADQLTLSMSLGIFGDHSFARYIASELKQQGFNKITFISSNCSSSKLDDLPVIKPADEQLAALNAIFLGSMALPQSQQKILEDNGYNGAIFAVPDGQTMCTEPRFDPTDKHALAALKNKHKGETFFVIGNGPSINATPPEQLKDGIFMAGNGILLRTEFRPDYYFLIDSICVDAWQPIIESLTVPILAVSHLAERMQGINNTLFYPVSYQTELADLNPADTGFFSGNTIICPMILFATYMGAKRIVILGVDNNYSKLATKNYHFHKDYYKNTDLVIDESTGKNLELRQQTGILHAVRTAQSMGVEVVDATPVDNNLGLVKADYHQFI
ncbi:6-hydroxymethylpterin diphosphokinase MptE-like protein [Arsukibacterium indicum]|uniref:DUF115 domain-containing protein n=1 Tax=Arsukibacterium indicum TaxID=2848612 RepID=A0ABS6MGF0_9GAMM|nr:6-hydroxymethylpterin diphosphokinase MptE-like protein [Arsukibacterium indicum]MBV2127874.1 DUF115 domain-containing protein [Arsukibacterium indicum]